MNDGGCLASNKMHMRQLSTDHDTCHDRGTSHQQVSVDLYSVANASIAQCNLANIFRHDAMLEQM